MGKYFVGTFANSGINLLTLCLAVNPFSPWVAQQRAVKLNLYLNFCSRPKPERVTVKEQNNLILREDKKSVAQVVLSSTFIVR